MIKFPKLENYQNRKLTDLKKCGIGEFPNFYNIIEN